MYKVVLLRHGESTWNMENRFTGWADVDLSERVFAEAHRAGHLLKAEGYVFDVAFTSVLKRAIRTLWVTLDEMDLMAERKKDGADLGFARVAERRHRALSPRAPLLRLRSAISYFGTGRIRGNEWGDYGLT